MRESFLNLDRIYKDTKIEVKLFDQIFYVTMNQLRNLYIDPLIEWDRRELAKKMVEKAITTQS